MSQNFPMGGSESWKHTNESEESWQARMQRSRKESDEEFKFRADLKNGSGFLDRALSGKLFERKISPVDVAHEKALETDLEVNQWLASRKEREDRDASRRNKFEALEKEIDSLRASLAEQEASPSPDSMDITVLKAKIEAKVREKGYWEQLR